MVYNDTMSKKIGAILCCIVLCLSLCCVTAGWAMAADGNYVLIENEGIQFIVNSDIGLDTFVLPKGFTVAYRGETSTLDGIEYARVTYAGMEGRIRKSDLDKCSVSPTAIDLPSVTVTSNLNGVFRIKEDGSRPFEDLSEGETLTFLGMRTVGDIPYFAVCRNGDRYNVYFVPQANANADEITQTLYPQEPQPVVPENPSGTVNVGDTDKSDSIPWARLVLIIGIIVPIILLFFLLFKPKRGAKRPRRQIYDQDEEDYDIDEM